MVIARAPDGLIACTSNTAADLCVNNPFRLATPFACLKNKTRRP